MPLNHGDVCHRPLHSPVCWKAHAQLLPLTWDHDIPTLNLIKTRPPRCSPYGMEMQAAFLISRLQGQTVPRHANNSQIIQEVVRGAGTQTEATLTASLKVWFSFSFLICHHSNIKNSPLNETIYEFYSFLFLLQKFLLLLRR